MHETEDTMTDIKALGILNTDRMDAEEVLVTFSDNTTATFTAEQLSAIRPRKDRTEEEPI
ncbi:hypothetical protein BH10ACI4_BH10ACI4_12830 [soil metagenome]